MVIRDGTWNIRPTTTSDARVVFQPREPARAIRPEAAQNPDFADSRANVARTTVIRRRSTRSTTGRRLEPSATNTTAPDVARAKYRPRKRMPRRRSPPRSCDRCVTRLPGEAPFSNEPISNTGDAHLFARRRRCGGHK